MGRQADEGWSQYLAIGTSYYMGPPKDFITPSPNARLKDPWEDCRGLVSMHLIWYDVLMNVSRVVFRWIVTQDFFTGLIIKFKVFLCFAI